MRTPLLTAVMLATLAGPALAQQGRIVGTVRDDRGEPVRGATIIAENADASPSSFTASSDDKGRFAMIGLKSGVWSFRAGAPGHASDGGEMTVRAGVNPALNFRLDTVTAPPSALGSTAPKDLQTALASADTLYTAQRWDDAIAAYTEILERSPSLSVINLQIAAAYRNKKAYDDAIKAYNALLKADPGNDEARIGIAMVNLDRGDLETAERTLAAAAQDPGAPREVFYDLGLVKMARSQPDEAVKAYQRASELDPTWGKPHFALGRIALEKGDPASARRHFEIVKDVDPASPEAAEATTMLQKLDETR